MNRKQIFLVVLAVLLITVIMTLCSLPVDAQSWFQPRDTIISTAKGDSGSAICIVVSPVVDSSKHVVYFLNASDSLFFSEKDKWDLIHRRKKVK